MLIIISPAKQMVSSDYGLAPQQWPRFYAEAQGIVEQLKPLSVNELKTLYGSSVSIAALNHARLQEFGKAQLPALTPAIYAYQGLQYQAMGAKVLTDTQYQWLEQHLRILSALYGLLRPFDGVEPYRLEMQARFCPQAGQSLYDFWRPRVTQALLEQGKSPRPVLINLASAEYAKAVDLSAFDCYDVRFCVRKDDKLVEQGAWCKKARGAMVHYLSAIEASVPQAMQGFNDFNFHFAPQASSERQYVFIKE